MSHTNADVLQNKCFPLCVGVSSTRKQRFKSLKTEIFTITSHSTDFFKTGFCEIMLSQFNLCMPTVALCIEGNVPEKTKLVAVYRFLYVWLALLGISTSLQRKFALLPPPPLAAFTGVQIWTTAFFMHTHTHLHLYLHLSCVLLLAGGASAANYSCKRIHLSLDT